MPQTWSEEKPFIARSAAQTAITTGKYLSSVFFRFVRRQGRPRPEQGKTRQDKARQGKTHSTR